MFTSYHDNNNNKRCDEECIETAHILLEGIILFCLLYSNKLMCNSKMEYMYQQKISSTIFSSFKTIINHA